MKWNEKPIVPWRAKASSFEGQLNVYACDELFRMHGCSIGVYAWVQVYMPINDYTGVDFENNNETSDILHKEGRAHVNDILIDFNSIVEEWSRNTMVGPFRLCRDTHRFTKTCYLIVMNACFKKSKTKLYTWKSPRVRNCYQIDSHTWWFEP